MHLLLYYFSLKIWTVFSSKVQTDTYAMSTVYGSFSGVCVERGGGIFHKHLHFLSEI